MHYLQLARDGCLCWQLSLQNRSIPTANITGTRQEYNDMSMSFCFCRLERPPLVHAVNDLCVSIPPAPAHRLDEAH